MEFNSFVKETAPTQGYYAFPADAASWYEFLMGLVLGLYPVVAARSRDYDCWTRHVQLTVSLIDWSFFLDEKFDYTNAATVMQTVFKMVVDFLGTYNLLYHCKQ